MKIESLVQLKESAPAGSDEVAQAFRDDVARRSNMMPPGSGASLADDLCHSVLGWSIAGDVERIACPA
jgi:hypothetical protein